MIQIPAEGRSEIRRTVVLVDDDEAVRHSLGLLLASCGFDVLEARSGDEALQILREFSGEIHAWVMDMAMPQMWGDVVAERLSILRPNARVLFISGHSEERLVSLGRMSGRESFLPKPFGIDALLAKVRELVEDAVKSA